MKVLLDTNVLIAAFIAHGTCHELLESVARNHELVSSKYILGELEDRLRYKFKCTKKDARDTVGLISERAEVVTPVEVETASPIDPDDLPVLGSAVAGSCDCLVTGDKELQKLGHVEEIPIISPSQFWKLEDEEL